MKVKILSLLLLLALSILSVQIYLEYKCYSSSNNADVTVEELSNNLNSCFTCVRSKAAHEAQQVGLKVGINAKELVPRLIELLHDKDPSVRWRSVAALGYIGFFTDEVRKEIFNMINDENPIVRVNTVFAVSQIPTEQSPDSKERTIRYSYLYTPEELDIYIKAMNDKDAMVVYKGLLHFTPVHLGSPPSQKNDTIIKTLRELYKNTEEKVRGLALLHLAGLIGLDEIEKEMPDFRTHLTELKKSSNQYVQRGAEKMLESIEQGLSLKISDYTFNGMTKNDMTKVDQAPKNTDPIGPKAEDIKLCLETKNRSACNRMVSIARREYSVHQKKEFFKEYCDKHSEVRSCLHYAVMHHQDNDQSLRDDYFRKVLDISIAQCSTGDFEYCAAEIMMLCALGRYEEGEQRRASLCSDGDARCGKIPECGKMLGALVEDLLR